MARARTWPVDLRRLTELSVIRQSKGIVLAVDDVDAHTDKPHHLIDLGVDGEGADASGRAGKAGGKGKVVV